MGVVGGGRGWRTLTCPFLLFPCFFLLRLTSYLPLISLIFTLPFSLFPLVLLSFNCHLSILCPLFHRLPFHNLSTFILVPSSTSSLCVYSHPPLVHASFPYISSYFLLPYSSSPPLFCLPSTRLTSSHLSHVIFLCFLSTHPFSNCFVLHYSSLSSSPHVLSLLFTPSTPSLYVGMYSLFMLFYLPSCMTYSLCVTHFSPPFIFFFTSTTSFIFPFASLFWHAHFPSLLPSSSSSHLLHLSLCYSTSQH